MNCGGGQAQKSSTLGHSSRSIVEWRGRANEVNERLLIKPAGKIIVFFIVRASTAISTRRRVTSYGGASCRLPSAHALPTVLYHHRRHRVLLCFLFPPFSYVTQTHSHNAAAASSRRRAITADSSYNRRTNRRSIVGLINSLREANLT